MSDNEWTNKVPLRSKSRRTNLSVVRSRKRRKKRLQGGSSSSRPCGVYTKKQGQSPGEKAREANRRKLSSRVRRSREAKDLKCLQSAQRGQENTGRLRVVGAQIRTIIALDLGRKTGYAIWRRDQGLVALDTWETMTEKEIKGRALEFRRFDPRPKVLWRNICEEVAKSLDPVMIVFEDVEFQSYTLQTQQWAGYRTALWLVPGVRFYDCVPVGTLKLFATGYGGASKDQMKNAFLRSTGKKITDLDDNAIDAFFILEWTLTKYGI